jgi:hypothetical protein
LTGCATQRLEAGLSKTVGELVSILVNAWGYPAAEREIMGHKLYTWSNNGGAMAVPLYGGGFYAARLTCTVEVSVDDKDTITSYQWSGNNGGCAAMARRIPD